jgi:hypothetical protein
MNNPDKKRLRALARRWQKQGNAYLKSAKQTWRKLENGHIAQEDGIIYLVYEHNAISTALFVCAKELEQLANELDAD